uniref:Uncharacterized protein n=1 Tax=Tanacetum cinerariifolium TaxID=118510 RepID=A0A699HWB9_TANCI|nr:hypothetical protein [Tanacetum cinerariifolium]
MKMVTLLVFPLLALISTASASVATISQDTACAYIASQSNGSQVKFEDINQIDEDDMEEMDIKRNMELLSMRADKIWKRIGKKISIQGSDVAGFDKSKVEHRSKDEEQDPKALMSIDGVGWDRSYMANDKEDHALVADEEAPIKFALMANTSTKSKVFDNSLCSKDCKKNNDSLKITYLTDKLFDAKNLIYHYKLALAQVESRLVEYKKREVKYCEKIRTLEFYNGSNTECIEILKKKLETFKQEKEVVDRKLAGLLTASKDLDNIIESQRADKNKEGLGYSVVPPPPAQLYSFPKKDLSWTGLPECKDDTLTDYSRPEPTVESSLDDDKKRNPSVSETVASPIIPKPFVKFVKASDRQSKSKIDETETPKKSPVKKRVKRGTTRSQNNTSKIPAHRPVVHRPHEPPMRPMRSNMNGARPNRTSFNKPAHSYTNRPFQRKSTVRSQYRAPWVPTVNRNFPPVNRKFFTGSRKFSTGNRKFSTASRKFPTGSTKFSTADMGMKGKAIKPSACWVLKPSHDLSNKGPNNNSVSVMFKKYTYIDTQGRLNGCSRHMTGNMSYLSDYEPFDGGYVSFGQGGCKITGKGTIKTGKLEFENVYFVKDLKRLGHLNFKTMHKLVRHNLVRGFPTKCFENDHNCIDFLKGKQHKASCKSKLVNSVSKPLHILHMDLFGPTSKQLTLLVMSKTESVLVNKSHNKTPYELFNGRTPAIRFLKPFGCHVMILNTLDNLGKFEAKGDEGYFIGYSMSSKAFRVFNKRTKRVKENLHIEFLNNKAIEKGAGPNWLFDIDFLTKSMNYVPVVDAGTNSTNFSGTKDAAGQEMKKDVSTLRYIALPNWAHDAFLESSLSKSQDDCNTDVSESSRNTNPTATSTIPSADQVETLTVESPIPTAKPKKIFDALQDPSWVEAMQEELLQFKIQKVWTLVNCPKGEEGIDNDEVVAPVVRIKAIRLFLAYASFMGFTVYQIDVKSAFLYGTIDEEVGTIDQTLFIRRQRGDFILVQVYVDEIIFRSSNPQLCREFEALMHEKFQMSAMDLQILPWTKRILRERTVLEKMHQVTPKECHLHAVKRIFRYLKGHPKLGLWYPKDSLFDLVASSDSDYDGATQDLKSTTRGCQFLGRRLISWQCKKQTIVATSTTEAEYVAAASCCG